AAPAQAARRWLSALRIVALGQQAGVDDLKIVIFREIDNEMVRKGFDFAQLFVDDDGFDAVQDGRTDIRRVPEVWLPPSGALRSKGGHHAAQALGPVAGAKLSPVARDALDEKLACLLFVRIGHEYLVGAKCLLCRGRSGVMCLAMTPRLQPLDRTSMD